MASREALVETPTIDDSPEEQFLADLYLRARMWALEQGLELMVEFDSQQVSHFNLAGGRDPGTSISLPLRLHQGVILAKENLILAFALGTGFRSRYEDEAPTRLMFGGSYYSATEEERRRRTEYRLGSRTSLDWSIRDLRWFVRATPRFGDIFSGEFTFSPDPNAPEDHRRRIEINCWADQWRTGGKAIGGYDNRKGWPKERIMSDEGLVACVEIIDRTIKQGKAPY